MATTTTTLDQSGGQEREEVKVVVPGRRGRLIPHLRGIAVALPLFLFAVAALAGLGFYATANPLFSTLAIALALAAGFLSILMAAFLPNQ